MKIEGGMQTNVWRSMTGAPTEYIQISEYNGDKDKLYKRMKLHFDSDWVVGAATPGDKSLTKLVEGHAYAVLGIYEVISKSN